MARNTLMDVGTIKDRIISLLRILAMYELALIQRYHGNTFSYPGTRRSITHGYPGTHLLDRASSHSD